MARKKDVNNTQGNDIASNNISIRNKNDSIKLNTTNTVYNNGNIEINSTDKYSKINTCTRKNVDSIKKRENKNIKIPYTDIKITNLKSKNDPNGSYTGCPTDGGEPVQDADDL